MNFARPDSAPGCRSGNGFPSSWRRPDRPRKLLLKVDVGETNIDRLQRASCEEIFAEREREYQESYRDIPLLDELCSRYGDADNRKIYIMSRDVEGRWLDMHLFLPCSAAL